MLGQFVFMFQARFYSLQKFIMVIRLIISVCNKKNKHFETIISNSNLVSAC